VRAHPDAAAARPLLEQAAREQPETALWQR
jgi:hypothetical protein